MDEKQRVIVYVDGFNFYYGLKSKGWRKYYWLNVVDFFEKFMKSDQTLVEVNYFSAPSIDGQSRSRQSLLFQANKMNPKFFLHLGKYSTKQVECVKCKHQSNKHEEKKTDVAIASRIIRNVAKDICDISILVSADTDVIPALELVRELNPSHKLFVYFPPNRRSSDLQHFCDSKIDLDRYESRFKSEQLPENVTLNNGFVIAKPEHWKK